MALWNKLRTELDRAGRAAQVAIDEGKIRLEVFRLRRLADKAAQTLGYAVHRAQQSGGAADPAVVARLSATIAEHEAEAARLDAQLEELHRARGAAATTDGEAAPAAEQSGGAQVFVATPGPATPAAAAGAGSPASPPSASPPAVDPFGPGQDLVEPTDPSHPTAPTPGGTPAPAPADPFRL